MRLLNFYCLSLALSSVFILSCAGSVQEIERSLQEPIKITKITLLPFYSEPDYIEEESEEFRVAKEQFLTDALYNELISKVKGVDIAPLENSTSEIAKVKKDNPELIYKDKALKVGKDLSADAILIGNISDYSERRGGEFGVESPASVVFEVQLMNVADGEVIWEAYFVESQKTLLENVAEFRKFVKRRGKWITADKLAKEGVVEVVEKLNEFLKSSATTN